MLESFTKGRKVLWSGAERLSNIAPTLCCKRRRKHSATFRSEGWTSLTRIFFRSRFSDEAPLFETLQDAAEISTIESSSFLTLRSQVVITRQFRRERALQ